MGLTKREFSVLFELAEYGVLECPWAWAPEAKLLGYDGDEAEATIAKARQFAKQYLAEPDIPKLAEQAYFAYGQVRNFKNHQGLSMPPWEVLPDGIKEACCEAVQEACCEAIQEVLRRVQEVLRRA